MTRSHRTTRDAGGRLRRVGPGPRGWAGQALSCVLLLGVLLLTILLVPDMPGLNVALVVVAVLTGPSGRTRPGPALGPRLVPIRPAAGRACATARMGITPGT
jgi:hypothetical protein